MVDCSICGDKTKLETHHINFQRDFINGKNGTIHKDKKHIIKDSTANLVNLCQKCHDELHAGKFEIESKVSTTKGTKVKIK
jgi:AAA15 family ATPase/GTPase